MPSQSLNQGYLLKWGAFTFSLSTAAFQKLLRQDSWRWITVERFANDAAEQFVGRGPKIINLEGVIFAGYDPSVGLVGPAVSPGVVGTHQLDIMRYYGDQGTALQMVDGRGNVLGPWALIGIQEDSEYFLVNGAPQKQTFRMEFRYAPGDNDGGVVQYTPQTRTITQPQTFGGNVQSQLQASGLPATTAADAGAVTQAFQSANSSVLSQDTASNLARELARDFGYSGNGFRNALGVVQSTMNGSSWSDIDTIVNNGLPNAAQKLGAIGVSDQAAGNNALALMRAAPGDQDRGTFMNNAASQLTNTGTLQSMKDLGVDLNLGAINQNDRLNTIVGGLAQIQSTNPTGFANAFPPEQFGELNILASNAPAFSEYVASISSQTAMQ